MTPKQLQRKIDSLTRSIDRLENSLSDQRAGIRYLKELVEAALNEDIDE